MQLDNANIGKLADLVYPDRFQYPRLYFYLKFAQHKIEKIWCDDAESITSAIVKIKPTEFQSKSNALIWADENSDLDWLMNFSENRETLHFRTVLDWIYEKIKDSWSISEHYGHDVWYLPDDVQLGEPEYLVEDLRESDIEEVNRNWSYAKGKISGFVKKKIANGETFAIYLDGKLASYALFRENGSMGMLRTLPGFRGRGLAKSITYVMVKWIWAQGYIPHVYIAIDNAASQHLTGSCGFVKKDRQHWFVKQFSMSNEE